MLYMCKYILYSQDLVAWVTLRNYNIPSTESMPISQTAGKTKSFYILPFNTYDEDPSVTSRDALHVEVSGKKGQQTYITDFGISKRYICLKEYRTENYVKNDSIHPHIN